MFWKARAQSPGLGKKLIGFRRPCPEKAHAWSCPIGDRALCLAWYIVYHAVEADEMVLALLLEVLGRSPELGRTTGTSDELKAVGQPDEPMVSGTA